MDLEAIEEIKQLKARYFRYLDTKQWDKWRTIFTDDAVLVHPANRPEPVRGADAVVELVSTSLANVITIHHGHTPEIEVLDDGEARGVWAMSDVLLYESKLGGGPVRYEGAGHYIERYRLEHGIWKIAHIHLRRLHIEIIKRQRDGDTDLEMFFD